MSVLAIATVVSAFLYDPSAAPPTLEQASGWPLIAEDGAVQRRRGPLTLGAGDTVSVWMAALPQPEHAATLGTAFRRFEVDCPRGRLRRAEGFTQAPGADSPVPTDEGDADFAYPGSQPSWVGALLTGVCSPRE